MEAIYLSEEETALFLLLRKHQDFISTVIKAGVQDIKRGEATLRFNHEGVLMDIEVRQSVYKRKTAL